MSGSGMLEKHRLVVGSYARILYQDAVGRTRIALKFNDMVRSGNVGPIMLGRDHHDPGGTDSPLQRNRQCPGRQQHHGGHGHPLLCRQRRPGHEHGGPPQRRRRRHRQSHQRRVRPGPGRQWSGRRHHPSRDDLGRHGRGGARAWARNENAIATGIHFNAGHQATDHITLPFLADDEAVAKLVEETLDDVRYSRHPSVPAKAGFRVQRFRVPR